LCLAFPPENFVDELPELLSLSVSKDAAETPFAIFCKFAYLHMLINRKPHK
jgi:hypothetical protein